MMPVGAGAMAGETSGAFALLEREDELTALAGAVAAGREGRGGFALIDAAAGLGKSRLCAVAAERGATAGMEVLTASASRLDRELPFGIARKLFDRRLARAESAERERLLADAAGVASPLFGAGDVSEREEMALVYGLYWLTVGIADARPLLLVVDDAHWADSSSLRFLLYLAQRLEDLPVAMVVATRSEEPDADVESLGELRAAAGLGLLSPAKLSEAAVAHLVREGISSEAADAFCAACSAATAGNPFMVVELLRELRAEAIAPTEEAIGRVASLTPQVVLEALRRRLSELPAAATELARAAAVLEEDAALRHVATLAGLETDEGARVADELAGLGVLMPGDPLRFEHPLVVAGIVREIPAATRASMHRTAARLLLDEGRPPEHVVAHLLRSPRGGERWVAEALLDAAGEASARGAAAVAASWLRRALEEPAPADLRPPILAELGTASAAAGDLGAAEGALREAIETTPDPRGRARLCLALGRQLYLSNSPREAIAVFDRGAAGLDDHDDVLARELRAVTASAAWLDSTQAERAHREVEALLGEEREPTEAERAVLAQLAVQEGFMAGGSAERARALAHRALGDGAWIDAPQGPDMVTLGLITGGLSIAEAFEESIEIYTRVIATARQVGSVLAYASACYARGGAIYFTGRLAEARADLEESLSAGDGKWEMFRVAARSYLAYACLEQGDIAAARAALDDDTALDPAGAEQISYLDARARLALAEGDAATALATHLRAGELAAEVFGDVDPGAYPWRSGATLAALRLGDRDQAIALAEAELTLAREFGANRQLGMALRACGLAKGGGEGLAMLREAAEVLASSPAKLERAHALLELGAALRRGGERVEARDHLRIAADLADRLGARPLLDRAMEELRVAGARPRRIQITGVSSLTASELRVATMAADGMSNPQIAQALFVTRKAVEFHLGNVYSKLGIRSRKELLAALTPPG